MGPVGNALHALLACGDELRAEFAAQTLTKESCEQILYDNRPRQTLDEAVLGVAQELGATFLVHQNKAICSIQGVTRDGDSYGHATLKTILALLKPDTRNSS